MRRQYPGRTYLPNGDSYSRFIIFPSNWESPRAFFDIFWYIKYRFYSQGSSVPKQRMIKGNVNEVEDILEKQQRMRALIKEELDMLHGTTRPFYLTQSNKMHKDMKQDPLYPIPTSYMVIEPTDTFKDAVLKALYNPPGCEKHVKDLRRNVIRVMKVADTLGYNNLLIEEISRKHLTRIFKKLKDQVSATLYNRTRSHMISVFEILQEEEASDRNPAKQVAIEPTVEQKQTALSIKDINRILLYLKATDYCFYRFMYIFYHTGSRPVELCRLKYEDVDLIKGTYTVVIFKKKKKHKVVSKPIHNDVLHLWKELIKEAKPQEYLFGHGFKPGPKKYVGASYSNKYKEQIKNGLGIKENFYTLKHRKLSELRQFMLTTEAMELSRKVTQEAASHDSFATTEIYLGEEQSMINSLLKSVRSAISGSSTDI